MTSGICAYSSKLRYGYEVFSIALFEFHLILSSGDYLTGESEYGAAMKAYALYGAFFKEVENELGEKITLELHRKAHEKMGIEAGRKILVNTAAKHLI